ncbi:MAG: hypothetical protein M5U12_28685 [Verrucomicrobia bacterium]|nr:hypothetical protein [Verrucomicrobiota bacterium]
MNTVQEPELAVTPTVACPRCHTASPVGTLECPTCGRHFYVCCRTCGHLNLRTAVRCEACGGQLRVRRRSRHSAPVHQMVWPARWEWDHQRRWLLPLQVAVFIFGVGFGTFGIMALWSWISPWLSEPEPPPPAYLRPSGELAVSDPADLGL